MANPLLTGAPGETHLLLGNEAIVRGAIEAGIQFVSCYPGTPSSEVPDTFFRLAAEGAYTFEYSVNEKVALEVGGGATLAGALTLVTMKHVGVNVAADPLLTLTYIGSPGGFVLLSADDPGCHSSQNEQDNRIYARLAGMPCFEPSSAQEAKDMTRAALALSRELGAPVLLRTTTRVNHLRGPVDLAKPTMLPAPVGFQKNPSRFVPIPAFARPMHLRLLERLEALRGLAETSAFNAVSGAGTVGVIASGISRAYLADALLEADLTGKVKVLDLGFSYPLPEKLIAGFMEGLSTLLILEELEPVLETEIRALAQRLGLSLSILGKTPGPLPRFGEFDTALVAGALRSTLGLPEPEALACACGDAPQAPLPNRPPNLCAGCPHRATYVAVRKIYGDSAVYSSDIGCYTLGILPPLKAADFLVCMGSSISAGCGVSKAAGQPVVGFIGDSTFFHSGITGLVNAVFNRHDILLVILDNRTTAMTGHQPNPGVDKTTIGDNPVRVEIEPLVTGLVGAQNVRKVNPLNQKATLKAIEELKAMSGVRVLIAEEPCPLFARRAYGQKRTQVAYVAADCAQAAKDGSCGDCLNTLACPAFYLQDGKMAIDPLLCSGCMLCLQVCKNIKARKGDA